ncbi:MAG: hypothetical protein Q9N26_03435 [Aquificota bacterium]|nr:hypothetical protein [Aquificota bacterium]
MDLWKERLKEILNLPEDSKIVTKPYYRKIIKKNGKVYRALTVQYVHRGRRKYKHIPKAKEPHVFLTLAEDRKDTDISDLIEDLKSLIDSSAKKKKEDLKRDVIFLLTRLLTK